MTFFFLLGKLSKVMGFLAYPFTVIWHINNEKVIKRLGKFCQLNQGRVY